MRTPVEAMVRTSFAVFTALTIAGCADKTNKVAAPPTWGDPAAIETRVSVSATEIRPGEPMEITVVVRNPTASRVMLSFTSGCMIMFAVKDGAGVLVAPKGVLCTTNAPGLELAPHESVTQHFTWDGSEGAPGTWLPPGDYFVIGGLDRGVKRSPSPPVGIRIVAP